MMARGQSKKTIFSTLFAVFAAISLSSCAKTKDTKSMVSPDHYLAKSDFEGKTFSLVRGIEEADSNNSVGAVPGFSEDFGLVEVRITESEIQFLELFNPMNRTETRSILASYPIRDHFDIQREENDFKETTHKIVENRERPWSQRKFIRVDWSRPTNSMSRFNSFNGGMAPYENVIQLTDPKVEKDGHISWLNEFSMNEGTLFWAQASPGSRVVARTHLMPLKASDFVKLNYREKDFKRFGYFYTRQLLEDPEKGFLDSKLEDNTYALLHNICEAGRTDSSGKPLSCSTNQVVWHLSIGFAEKYKNVTRKAVREWNDVFKKALGRSDDVIVLNEEVQVDLIDPRYNTLAYYGAKSPGGLLGVAQWASNPVTGELIASRATIYEDGIRGTLGWVDDIITMILSDEEVRKLFLATDEEAKERLDRLFPSTGGFKVQEDIQKLRMSLGMPVIFDKKNGADSDLQVGLVSDQGQKSTRAVRDLRRHLNSPFQSQSYRKELVRKLSEPVGRTIARKEALMKKAPELFAVSEIDRIGGSVGGYDFTFGLIGARRPAKSRLPSIQGLEHLHDVGSALREERARMINQAHTGIHGSELVEEAAIRYIRKILAKYPNVNDFKSQVSVIKAEIDQLTFYTTLLHEMGHAFGLRHNFHGSSDSQHYHPEFNRLSKQMERESALPEDQRTVTSDDLHPYMFSSIMDYGGDFYAQAGGLGPYDSAAIKYAYNRSIDKNEDPVVKAGYKFCTDHQVNDSILCRRFDKGRNVSEITANMIEGYHNNWVLSHFRRDRANFDQRARSYPMNALVRYFIPIRQVMDEFIYSLIDAKDVAAGENECGMAHWRRSVEADEIVNVCNPLEAEAAGVDVTDLSTFVAGLFNEKGPRKAPTEYEAYGLADLVFADAIAKQFFVEVLGSTEPGTYLALPVSKGKFQLEGLSPDGNLDETLAQFAAERGIQASPETIAQMKQLVGKIGVGRYGKPFVSESDESGPFVRQKNIGAFFDKYVALIALGIKDLGIEKYYRRSMTGNAYAYPQTQSFAREMIKAMITQKDRILTIPFKTQVGLLPATVVPSLNLDLKSIGTITALVDFVSDSDESIADALRVCSLNDQGCRSGFGTKTIEFTTASGQDVFRSVQTLKEDSISYDLLSEAATIDKERKEWVTKLQKSSDTIASNIMKLEELKEKREALIKRLVELKIGELDEAIQVLFSNDPRAISVWNILTQLATKPEELPLFLTLNLAQQAGGAFEGVGRLLMDQVQKLDPKNECRLAELELNPEQNGEERDKQVPSVSGLRAQGSGQRLNRTSSMQTLNQLPGAVNGANNGNRQPRPAPKVDRSSLPAQCQAIELRFRELAGSIMQLQSFATASGEVINGVLDIKVAPLRVTRATSDLQRAEANIRLIRRVSKAVGLE
jgi:hypothetical protein